ncbi:hypothetical protein [Actinokineospora enzanensis]|uniref:hypothetical protein n=1 Tax=Actinokineospora enzanensis TaxID=155975 RepID=UPI00035CC875|nr:hypothetical protein [Actinokineospora enzanensis]
MPEPDPINRFGLSSDDLARLVTDTVNLANNRVIGVGNAQYARGGEQRFERLTIDELFTMLDEELLDGIVYLVMLRHQLNGKRAIHSQLARAIDEAIA